MLRVLIQTVINNMSEERLKHYNKILKEQLAELEQEILHVEGRFRAQFDFSPFNDVSPGAIMRDLARDVAGVQHAIRNLKKDLLAFEDIKTVRPGLRTCGTRQKWTILTTTYFEAGFRDELTVGRMIPDAGQV